MSTDPTTKSQVQAYRFVLRRMESALVRKDAVMLHEPMRHHLRATAVGLILGLLGLAVFFVVGKFQPVNAAGTKEVVIGNPAETVYVCASRDTLANGHSAHSARGQCAPRRRLIMNAVRAVPR